MSNTTSIITRQQVADDQRVNITANLLGANFSLLLEPFVFSVSNHCLSRENTSSGLLPYRLTSSSALG